MTAFHRLRQRQLRQLRLMLATGPMVAAFLMTGENDGLLINISVMGLIASMLVVIVPARLLERAVPA